ncbi:MAG: stability/partitioning determinant [Pseudomonadota bacterium]
MEKERASLGFGDELDAFDPTEWTPKPEKTANDRPKAEETKAAADAAGFKSREPAQPKPEKKRQQRRHTTGRNVQFNMKARQEDIDAFYAIADANGWVLGEALQHTIAAFNKVHGKTG